MTSVQTNLTPCPDCATAISPHAETCPQCGRPLLYRDLVVTPGTRWSWTIFWGLVLFVVIQALITIAIGVLILALVIGMARLGGK